jgi:hypothetical protein
MVKLAESEFDMVLFLNIRSLVVMDAVLHPMYSFYIGTIASFYGAAAALARGLSFL